MKNAIITGSKNTRLKGRKERKSLYLTEISSDIFPITHDSRPEGKFLTGQIFSPPKINYSWIWHVRMLFTFPITLTYAKQSNSCSMAPFKANITLRGLKTLIFGKLLFIFGVVRDQLLIKSFEKCFSIPVSWTEVRGLNCSKIGHPLCQY